MNPISRLRTRARSEAASVATGRPFSRYCPSLGESSRPRIDSRVDLPHPEGPAIETYSPFPISMWTSESAWVSTSSVKKTFVTPSSFRSGCVPFWPMLSSFRDGGPRDRTDCPGSSQPHAIEAVPLRHVGQNHRVADVQSRQHFDAVHGAFSQLDLYTVR